MSMRQEYTEYIKEHITNINKVWNDIQSYLVGEFWLDDLYWFTIDDLIKEHDKSKFGPHEFSGYRQYFYPESHEVKDNNAFRHAWNHHQKANKHHWEYWLYVDVKPNESITVYPLEMPFIYIFEMLCDWTAMSYKFGDTPTEFYIKEQDNMMLAENTILCIERHLPIFDKAATINKDRNKGRI